jgi:hypothetical protein
MCEMRRGQVDPDHERHPSAVVNRGAHYPRAARAGDAVANIAYRVRFSSCADRLQTAAVRRVDGAQAAETSDTGQVMIEATTPAPLDRTARNGRAPGMRSRAFAIGLDSP